MPAGVKNTQARHAGALRVRSVTARAYTIPTDRTESDGTLEWSSTTIVAVQVHTDEHSGFGYTYTAPAAAALIRQTLAPHLDGQVLASPEHAHDLLRSRARNFGAVGVVACALSAIDVACWDLFSRAGGISVLDLMGRSRERVPAYGSGGFTSYTITELAAHMSGWSERGFHAAKMKVGRCPVDDPDRVRAVRNVIGDDVALFVDANGAYCVRQAVALAQQLADMGVTWLEEPRPAEDVAGNREVRDRAPAGMEVTGGEYLWTVCEAFRMFEHNCYDVVQPDVTRCGGFTGFRRIATLAEAVHVPLSTHCAPTLSAQAALSCPGVRHVEYFHDHAIIEQRFFDGAVQPSDGQLRADSGRPGLGLTLKQRDIEPFAAD